MVPPVRDKIVADHSVKMAATYTRSINSIF